MPIYLETSEFLKCNSCGFVGYYDKKCPCGHRLNAGNGRYVTAYSEDGVARFSRYSRRIRELAVRINASTTTSAPPPAGNTEHNGLYVICYVSSTYLNAVRGDQLITISASPDVSWTILFDTGDVIAVAYDENRISRVPDGSSNLAHALTPWTVLGHHTDRRHTTLRGIDGEELTHRAPSLGVYSPGDIVYIDVINSLHQNPDLLPLGPSTGIVSAMPTTNSHWRIRETTPSAVAVDRGYNGLYDYPVIRRRPGRSYLRGSWGYEREDGCFETTVRGSDLLSASCAGISLPVPYSFDSRAVRQTSDVNVATSDAYISALQRALYSPSPLSQWVNRIPTTPSVVEAREDEWQLVLDPGDTPETGYQIVDGTDQSP
jgi:hypothetical protein